MILFTPTHRSPSPQASSRLHPSDIFSFSATDEFLSYTYLTSCHRLMRGKKIINIIHSCTRTNVVVVHQIKLLLIPASYIIMQDHVPAALLLLQLPTYVLGKAKENDTFGSLPFLWEMARSLSPLKLCLLNIYIYIYIYVYIYICVYILIYMYILGEDPLLYK